MCVVYCFSLFQDFSQAAKYCSSMLIAIETGVAEGKGAFVTGPKAILPYDFLRAATADCAALAPFAFQGEYIANRKGMFIAVLNANLHDLLYDIGSSSRISCAGYAFATGSLEHDLPQAFIVSTIDTVAVDCVDGRVDLHVQYGINVMFAACLWNLFNVRYRAWERLIKYTRLLQQSKNPAAATILDHAKNNMVFQSIDWTKDVEVLFKSCLDPASISKLVPRTSYAVDYTLDLSERRNALRRCKVGNLPDLCEICNEAFLRDFFQDDTVQAIKGLPQHVIDSDAVSIAAAIRRASVWATTAECCDACACLVASWANDVSDYVTIASMQSEQNLLAKDWLLECYVVGCVGFSPLRLMSITGGFDASVDITFEPGAMGPQRDIVDC